MPSPEHSADADDMAALVRAYRLLVELAGAYKPDPDPDPAEGDQAGEDRDDEAAA